MAKSKMEQYYHRWGNTDGAVAALKRDVRFYRYVGTKHEQRVVRAAWKQLVRDRAKLWRCCWKWEWRDKALRFEPRD